MKQFLHILLLSLMFSSSVFSQADCGIKRSKFNEILTIDANDAKCLSKNSEQKNTLFFTFGIWCGPCRAHLPNAIKLAKEHNINMYVLLVEAENDVKTAEAIKYLKAIKPDIQIAIIKDEIYGLKRNKKNKAFLTEITPPTFENIDDYSKYILLNQNGEVIMVTNWKDSKEDDNWKDDTEMVKRRIIPLL